MKLLLSVLLLSTCLATAYAQDNAPQKFIYCEIIGSTKYMNPDKVVIELDMGQERSYWKTNNLKDESGKVKSFNSMMDAVNYMGDQGWELVNAYSVVAGNQNSYHYVLKKRLI